MNVHAWRDAACGRGDCITNPRLALRTVGYECVRLADVLERAATDQDVRAYLRMDSHHHLQRQRLSRARRGDELASRSDEPHSRRKRQAEASRMLTLLRKAGQVWFASEDDDGR
jgi:hypothetical protein